MLHDGSRISGFRRVFPETTRRKTTGAFAKSVLNSGLPVCLGLWKKAAAIYWEKKKAFRGAGSGTKRQKRKRAAPGSHAEDMLVARIAG